MRLIYAQLTDVGRKRENNEDSLTIVEPGLFILADGLGGLPDGEVASREAVARVAHYFTSEKEPPEDWLVAAFEEANHKLYDLNRRKAPHEAMATTLTACHFRDKTLTIAHVGDCRVYRLRKALERLTTDHATGPFTLTRALGSDPAVAVDVYHHSVQPGDSYLLCSDGLHGVVEEESIRKILEEGRPEEICDKLVREANRRGGPDNISVQVITVF